VVTDVATVKLSWERFNAILEVSPILIGEVCDCRHQMDESKYASEKPHVGKLHV